MVIDRLELLTNEVLAIKRSLTATPIVPLPPAVKPGLVRTQEQIDAAVSEAYFSGLRAGADTLQSTTALSPVSQIAVEALILACKHSVSKAQTFRAACNSLAGNLS